MEDNILLLGGGLDSISYLILMKDEGIDFSCLSVNYGQMSYQGELQACIYFCNKYDVPLLLAENKQIEKYNDIKNCQLFTGNTNHDPYVSGRNASLILTALEYGNTIHIGFTDPGYEPFPDATPSFVIEFNNILTKTFKNKLLVAQYELMRRVDILGRAYEMDNDLFHESRTCWCCDSYGNECNVCKHCLLKEIQYKEIQDILN